MRIVIVGGRLQGMEASYLARESGWEVILVDRDPAVPARGLADRFHPCDVIRESTQVFQIIRQADLILPALENIEALTALKECARAAGTPMAYDPEAYQISRSKVRSNRLFKSLGIPTPLSWPECPFPVIAKPAESSGSRGVTKLSNLEALEAFFRRPGFSPEDWIVEEFLEGPSFSLEVVGLDGCYRVLQITELEMDDRYDCQRVLAPADLPETLAGRFKELSLAIAQAIRLKGIMDVEVIYHQGVLKILEIDARLPSQTPTTVFNSIGINMLEILRDIFIHHSLPEVPEFEPGRGVVYEHLKGTEEGLRFLGEHIMGEAGPLEKTDLFFGADFALTDFNPARSTWAATLVLTGGDRRQAWLKRCQVVDRIEGYLKGFYRFPENFERVSGGWRK